MNVLDFFKLIPKGYTLSITESLNGYLLILSYHRFHYQCHIIPEMLLATREEIQEHQIKILIENMIKKLHLNSNDQMQVPLIMDKSHWITLILGTPPAYYYINELQRMNLGQWIGGHSDRWEWNKTSLEELDERVLQEIYFKLKKYNEPQTKQKD
jgi:hypothetical protein